MSWTGRINEALRQLRDIRNDISISHEDDDFSTLENVLFCLDDAIEQTEENVEHYAPDLDAHDARQAANR